MKSRTRQLELGKPHSTVSAILCVAQKHFGDLEGLSVFDFGCGRGEKLDVLAHHGFRTFGLDPATHHKVTRHSMLSCIPESATFDMIISNHVFEHLSGSNAHTNRFAAGD